MIRTILLNLDDLNITESCNKGGRKVTRTGQQALDLVAGQVSRNEVWASQVVWQSSVPTPLQYCLNKVMQFNSSLLSLHILTFLYSFRSSRRFSCWKKIEITWIQDLRRTTQSTWKTRSECLEAIYVYKTTFKTRKIGFIFCWDILTSLKVFIKFPNCDRCSLL